MRISDWSSDVCSSDLAARSVPAGRLALRGGLLPDDADALVATHAASGDRVAAPGRPGRPNAGLALVPRTVRARGARRMDLTGRSCPDAADRRERVGIGATGRIRAAIRPAEGRVGK